MNDDDHYVEELRVVRRKTDTYRSNSSKSNEFESDLLRSKTTKNVAGPTESRSVDEEELRQRYQSDSSAVNADPARHDLSPGQQVLADAIVEVSGMVIRELVVPLIRDVAAPAARAKWNELTDRRRARAFERSKAQAPNAAPVEAEVGDQPHSTLPSAELGSVEPSVQMRKSDFLLAQLQLKLAQDFLTRQRWLVEHAQIVEDDLPPALEQSLALMLEDDTDAMGDDEREAVAHLLQRISEPAGDDVPAASAPDGPGEAPDDTTSI